MRWIELCAGAAACTLAMATSDKPPQPVTWLGGKRRYAWQLLEFAGIRPQTRPEVVELVEAGDWGWVWPLLVDRGTREAICEILRGWAGRGGELLWRDLASTRPCDLEDPELAATWLALQAGNALGKAVRGDTTRWRTAGYGKLSPSAVRLGFRDRLLPGHLATKVDRCGRLLARMQPAILHMTVQEWAERGGLHDLGAGDVVFFDPPYAGRTGYGIGLPRADVLSIATLCAATGATVIVCEAEPLPLDGWHHIELTDRSADDRPTQAQREFVTMSRRPSPASQGGLFA